MKKLLLFLLFGVMSASIAEAKKTGTPRKNQPEKGKKQTYQNKNNTTKTGTPRKNQPEKGKKPHKKKPKKTAEKAKQSRQTNYDADDYFDSSDDFNEPPHTPAPAHTSGFGGGNWASSLQGLLGGAQGTLQQVNALKQQATNTFGGGQAQEEYDASFEE